MLEYIAAKKAPSNLLTQPNCELRQEVLYVDQVVVKDLPGNIQQVKNLRIANRIQNTLPVLPSDNNVASSQDGQLLRECALFYVESEAKSGDSDFTPAQFIENPGSHGVSQRSKELRRELT
jgi:hypothetical protein